MMNRVITSLMEYIAFPISFIIWALSGGKEPEYQEQKEDHNGYEYTGFDY